MLGSNCGTVASAVRKHALYAVVIAAGFGWYARNVWRRHQAVEAVLAAGGSVTYDLYGSQGAKPWQEPVTVTRGDAHFCHDLYRTPTEAQAENCRRGDALCKRLAKLPQLRFLKLAGSQVTDAGLARLAGLRKLEALNCNGAQITDAGLAHLAGMPRLWQLMLSDTQVSDYGMAHLMKLSHLRWLAVEHTRVSEAGIKRLQMAVPRLGGVVYTTKASKPPAAARDRLVPHKDSNPPALASDRSLPAD